MNKHFRDDTPKAAKIAFYLFLSAGLFAPTVIIGGYLIEWIL